MQWLIDLVLAKVIAETGIPPTYIPRISGIIADFDKTDFTQDADYHTLDLSGIVPAGVAAVNLSLKAQGVGVGDIVRFRHPADTRAQGRCIHWTQGAGLDGAEVWAQGVDSNRHCQYYVSNVVWATLNLYIRGWWI